MPYVPRILTAAADKASEVHTAALNAGRALVNVMCPYGARFVLPHITTAMAPSLRWQQKYAACVQLRDLLARAPESCADGLPTFFPPLRNLMTDARDEVKEAALAAMQIALTLVNNRDFEPLQQACPRHVRTCDPCRKPPPPPLWLPRGNFSSHPGSAPCWPLRRGHAECTAVSQGVQPEAPGLSCDCLHRAELNRQSASWDGGCIADLACCPDRRFVRRATCCSHQERCLRLSCLGARSQPSGGTCSAGRATTVPPCVTHGSMQDVIACILKPSTVPDTIVKLAATTFAQPVESKMLSVMVPLLMRGLRERNNAIRRQTAVIITNMVKLVERPADLASFMPVLLPEVDKVGKEISDPNARAVAVNTHALLVKAAGSEDGAEALAAEQAKRASPEVRSRPPSRLRTCSERLCGGGGPLLRITGLRGQRPGVSRARPVVHPLQRRCHVRHTTPLPGIV